MAVKKIPCKSIVTKNKTSSWFGSLYNMNIYRGCSHGCIYCDSRSSCYRIENFDEVSIKENALEKIRDDLRRKSISGVVATGSMSDPYNPLEKKLELTRHALELVSSFGFGAAVATKSPLVTRDIDILEEIKAHSPAIVKITVTTADDELAKLIEPRVASSTKRFEAIERLAEKDIFTGILLMPLLPFITDKEENIRNIVKKANHSGAKFIYPSFGVTLRDNQREWYFDKLDEIFPNENFRRQYSSCFGDSYACNSLLSKKLWKIFITECNKFGMLYKMSDIIQASKAGLYKKQISLFD